MRLGQRTFRPDNEEDRLTCCFNISSVNKKVGKRDEQIGNADDDAVNKRLSYCSVQNERTASDACVYSRQ